MTHGFIRAGEISALTIVDKCEEEVRPIENDGVFCPCDFAGGDWVELAWDLGMHNSGFGLIFANHVPLIDS